jgi:hypothetical protein
MIKENIFKDTHWREGQSVQAHVEELIDADFFIVSLKGYLFRVRNISNKHFQAGDEIHLIVHNEKPLEFHLDPRFYNKRSFERFA